MFSAILDAAAERVEYGVKMETSTPAAFIISFAHREIVALVVAVYGGQVIIKMF